MKICILTLLVPGMLILSVNTQKCVISRSPTVSERPPYQCGVTLIVYDKKMQKEIVDIHNHFRSIVNPTAANMEYMYWDEALASMALKHSERCVFEHDTYEQRSMDGYRNIGQNLFVSQLEPETIQPVEAWHGEVANFTFGKTTTATVGHYTQVVQDKAARIGCGGAYCPNLNMPYLITCNYLRGQFDVIKPYKLGESCADCSSNCRNKLCDCEGKVCKYGGKLNLNNCTCTCQGATYGHLCEFINCNITEFSECSEYEKRNYCDIKYGYLVRNVCPISCKRCP